MAYKRKYVRRKFKRRAKTGPKSLAIISKKVSNLEKNIEWKVVDIYNNAVNPTSAAPSVTSFCSVAKGTDSDERDGRVINVKSLQIRAYINYNQSNVTPSLDTLGQNILLRYIIFTDLANAGSLPDPDDLLKASANGMVTMRNLSYMNRFKVLKDKTMQLTQNNAVKVIEHYFKFPNHRVRYNSNNSGTVADIESNGIYMMILTDINDAAFYVRIQSRVRFIDS